ncbi:zinc finger protein 862-like [Gigantopelta aegis]|uniref:zinc finger protein 862-like n=1 Tax=Gigantopelta aegis TaxID=1735272 RepID=UPI001B889984|nr:zinc finger protein 862-like [Gigantopelta aegis]
MNTGCDLHHDMTVDKFINTVRIPFLTNLVNNISERFQDSDIVNSLAILDVSALNEDVPALYGEMEMEALAVHFNMPEENLLMEWTNFLSLMSSSTFDKTLPGIGKVLLGPDKSGLQAMYPLLAKLVSVALTLPLSSAECERVFSHLKMIKTDRRSKLNVPTISKLLQIKLNWKFIHVETLLNKTTEKFLSVKNRRCCNL